MCDSVGGRIKTVVEESGLSVHAFAKSAGISDTAIRDFIHDRKSPGMQALLDISDTGGVMVDWLLTGEGLKYRCDAEALDVVELFGEFARGPFTVEKMTRILAAHIARTKDKTLREKMAAAFDKREQVLESLNLAAHRNKSEMAPVRKTSTEKKKKG